MIPKDCSGTITLVLICSIILPGFAQYGVQQNGYQSNDLQPLVQEEALANQPTIREVTWSIEDTTVDLLMFFNEIPIRYSAYALQNPDRIVLDCFGTESEVSIDTKKLPAPVKHIEFGVQDVGDEQLKLIRLVLFTSKAVTYHLDETSTRLRLSLDWNTRIEHQKNRQSRSRKVLWGTVITGTGIAAAGAAAAVITSVRKKEPPAAEPIGEIPPPDIPTPDAN